MIASADLIALALILAGTSGAFTVLLRRDSDTGQRLSFAVLTVATALGLVGSFLGMLGGDQVPSITGMDYLRLDRLSAFFLVPLFVVGFSAALFALGYWKQSDHGANGQKASLFYGTMLAGIGLVMLAGHALVFLVGWEIMALSAFFLVTTDDESGEAREAGWIYFVATHVSTLLLFGLFAFLGARFGTYSFQALPLAMNADTANGIFLVALVAFGLKAGLFPLHVWLPPAHASAPGHVSAVMSGVLIKVGVYGILRILSTVSHPPVWWGLLLLGAGVVSGLVGVVFAIGQHDSKRLLAYHSIENIGIIFAGMGVATLGAALEQPGWVVLGMGGALLHVWNHALFKSLLFEGAGSIMHAAGQRDLDAMGGLARAMPVTSACFLTGSVAICGLPFLNGFVSELLIYLGLMRMSLHGHSWISVSGLLSILGLAMMGALALLCFVKVYGVAFLGVPRRHATDDVRESPATMTSAMILLAGLCIVIGVFPLVVVPVLSSVLFEWMGAGGSSGGAESATAIPGLDSLAPLAELSLLGGTALLVVLAAMLWMARRRRTAPVVETWACGYGEVRPSMQYTSSSFALFTVQQFRWLLWPRQISPEITGLLPGRSHLSSHVIDFILDRFLLRGFPFLADLAQRARVFQAGQGQLYILYILITLVLLLLMRQA